MTNETNYSTAVHDGGYRVQMNNDTSVVIDGVHMQRAQAEELGLVKPQRSAEQAPNTGTTEAQQGDEQDQTEADNNSDSEDGPVAFEGDGEEIARAAAAAIPAEYHSGIIEQAITASLSGDANALDLQTAATAGLASEEFVRHVSTVFDQFAAQADALIEARGIEPSEFYEHVKRTDPDGLRRAMREHAMTRNPKVWAPLIETYQRKTRT